MKRNRFGSLNVRSAERPTPATPEPPIRPNNPLVTEFEQPPARNEMPVTGTEIARELAKDRIAADEGISRDALIYLRAGMSPTGVVEIIRLRWGATVPKEKIEQVVQMAFQLENNRRENNE